MVKLLIIGSLLCICSKEYDTREGLALTPFGPDASGRLIVLDSLLFSVTWTKNGLAVDDFLAIQ